MADLNSSDVNTDLGSTKPSASPYISLGVTAGILTFAAITLWIIWLKCCKSPRSKHGVEKSEAKANGVKKREYYDQFQVNDHQCTVNSVTAIKWDEEERLSNKSSGIDCDSHSSDSKEIKKVSSGKRVFSVNKVTEKQKPTTAYNNGPVVIRLPRQFSEVARSLQSGDNKNFTLAIIDRQSQTVHNLDMKNYRMKRAVSPLADGQSAAHPRLYYSNRRRRHRSDGNKHGRTDNDTVSELIHDSPDLARKMNTPRCKLDNRVKSDTTLPQDPSTAAISSTATPETCTDSSNDFDDNNDNENTNLISSHLSKDAATRASDVIELHPEGIVGDSEEQKLI